MTPVCRNPVMWTMYTKYYKGICIGFEKLENAKKIEYRNNISNRKLVIYDSPEFTEKYLIETLLVKYDLWQYENEYRIISKEKFLNIEKNIKFIILGHNLNKDIKNILYEECKRNNINVFETYISYTKNHVIIKKYGYNIEMDGSEVQDDLNEEF